MEQSPSWEANSYSANQEIHRLVWKPKVHYGIRKSSPLSLSWARFIQSIKKLDCAFIVEYYLNSGSYKNYKNSFL
jgi:hypothetical protein